MPIHSLFLADLSGIHKVVPVPALKRGIVTLPAAGTFPPFAMRMCCMAGNHLEPTGRVHGRDFLKENGERTLEPNLTLSSQPGQMIPPSIRGRSREVTVDSYRTLVH